MLQIQLSSVINEIVQHELLKPCNANEDVPTNKAIYINLKLSLHSYLGDGNNFSQMRGLHLLYHKSFMSSAYVNVFSAVTSSPAVKIESINWEHVTSHDSVWRNIHTFSDIYFEMAEVINKEREAKQLEKIAPALMHESHQFRNGLFNWVDVKVSKDPSCSSSYKKLIQVIK